MTIFGDLWLSNVSHAGASELWDDNYVRICGFAIDVLEHVSAPNGRKGLAMVAQERLRSGWQRPGPSWQPSLPRKLCGAAWSSEAWRELRR